MNKIQGQIQGKMLQTTFLFSILFSQQGPTYWPVLQLLNKVLGKGVDIGVCYPISSKQDLGNLNLRGASLL